MDDKRYAFSVQVEDRWGVMRVVARVCTVKDAGKGFGESGELRSILSSDRDPHADFQVGAYVDEGDDGVWGVTYGYHDASVDSADQARAMARLLSKVDKGLDRLASERGYADGFGDTLLRVAEVLRIRDIHVRNSARRRSMAGDAWRVVDGRGLLSWVEEIQATAVDADRSVRREYVDVRS